MENLKVKLGRFNVNFVWPRRRLLPWVYLLKVFCRIGSSVLISGRASASKNIRDFRSVGRIIVENVWFYFDQTRSRS